MPDKAIDLIDEACSMIKTEMQSMPQELDEVSRKIMQLEIEETALSKETDQISKTRLEDIQKENLHMHRAGARNRAAHGVQAHGDREVEICKVA